MVRSEQRRHVAAVMLVGVLATGCGSSAGPSASSGPTAAGPTPAATATAATTPAAPVDTPSPTASVATGLADCAPGADLPAGRILFDITFGDRSKVALVVPDGTGYVDLTERIPGVDGAGSWMGDDRLVFGSDRDGNIHLFAMHSDGGNVKQLTSGASFDDFPSVSPDGSLIAYESNPDGKPNGIFVAKANGREPRRLTTGVGDPGFDTGPDFAPDGTSIAFTRVLDSTPGQARSAIMVVDAGGGEARQLTDWELNGHHPSFSPDGRRIVFSSNADNFTGDDPADLWIVNADGTGLTQLTHEPAGGHAFEPAWSPDGGWIAHAHIDPGASSVDLAITDTTGARQCVVRRGTNEGVKNPDWGPVAG